MLENATAYGKFHTPGTASGDLCLGREAGDKGESLRTLSTFVGYIYLQLLKPLTLVKGG